MEAGLTNAGLDFIEEGRRNIFEWGEKRRSNRRGLKGRVYEITKLFIDRSILRSFINNLSIVVGFQMLLAGFCTYACAQLNLEFDVQMSLFVSPIVFPLAFSINANYQRRETVLEDLAMFKAASLILFFCHRDWIKATGLPTDLLKTLSNKLKFLVINIREYLLTDESQKRQFIVQAIYEDFSDISQLNDKLRASELKSNSSLIARVIHCHNLMCWSFEKLRVIREYTSPRSLRSFTKVFIFFMPLLLSPYYVYRGTQTHSPWAPYYISALVSFLFGSLQAVQDKLDDPFDGIGEDDVNLGQLDDWTTQSLLTNRVVKVGRFTVTTRTSGSQDDDCGRTSPLRTHFSEQEPIVLNKISSPSKRRRSSTKKRNSTDRVLNDEQFSTELEARCHGIASKLEGLSGNTTILPGNRTKSYDVEPEKQPRSPRSVLFQGGGLEIVRESDEYDVSTDTSPVSQSYSARSENKSTKPALTNVFNNDTDTVTSDDSAAGEGDLIKNKGFSTFTNSKTDRATLATPDITEDSTGDENEPLNFVTKTQPEKRPSVMELFGLNKATDSTPTDERKMGDEKEPEQLRLLSTKDNTSHSQSPCRHLHSPVASCDEDFSEDNQDDVITERSARSMPRHHSVPNKNNLPNIKFSSARHKQWSMPDRLSKWRKRRPKKRSSGRTVEQDGSKSHDIVTTPTTLLLSTMGTGSESRDNDGNELSPDRTSQSFEENTPECKQTESKERQELKGSAAEELPPVQLNPVNTSQPNLVETLHPIPSQTLQLNTIETSNPTQTSQPNPVETLHPNPDESKVTKKPKSRFSVSKT